MAGPNRPVAVLVDAYSTGSFLPPAFHRLGIDVVHVQSTPEPLRGMIGPDPAHFLECLTDGAARPARTAERLAAFDPIAVAAGQEPGVPLADELSERLGLPTNGTALSPARRDKFAMTDALRRAGLRCAEQFQSDDAEEIVAWAEHRADYPVVVKPLSSSGTDHVEICASPETVRKAAEAVLDSSTIYGDANSTALVQSYLAGTEYVVDTVSWQGGHYVCGIWKSRKTLRGTRNVYDLERLVPEDDAIVAPLTEYVHEVLDVIGIAHGPAHAEVIVTAAGPALVEIGARLAGHLHPGFHQECLGGDQAALTALAYGRPAEFLRKHAGRRYTKALEAGVYATPTALDGVIERIDQAVLDEIKALPSVFDVIVKRREGERLRPTVDLVSSTLRVLLRAETDRALMRDYRRVGELKDRVFRMGA